MNSSRWKYIDALSYCIKVVDGTHDSPKRKELGKPLITSKHIKGRNIDFENAYFISQEDYDKANSRSKVDQWDVLISMIGEYCGYCYVERNPIVDYAVKNVGIFKAGSKHKAEWLYYYLNSPEGKNTLSSVKSGTSQPYISLGALRSLPILVPNSERESQQIVSVLSSIDEKIELNRQTNATLEAILQAFFKEWFVEFNLPGTTGEMVEGELGLIPKGWKVLPLDEIADFLNGLALQKYPAEDEKDYLPVIKIRELKNGITNSTDRASKNIPDKYIVKDGDLIFSWSGTLEVKFWIGGEGALNQHLFKVTSKEYPLWFCYFWVLHHISNFRDIAEDKTTTMGHIQRHHLSEALCFVPANLFEIDKVIKPLIDKIINLEQQTATLAAVRDALLPKLMSGEVSVKG